MTSTSDIDVAVLHQEGASEGVTDALEDIGESVQRRFGNRLSFILEDLPAEELQRSRREGLRLWRQILRDGIPILDPPPRPADG